VFEYIIYSAACPFVVGGELEFEFLADGYRIAGAGAGEIHPDVIVFICIRMADDEEYPVGCTRVFYFELKFGLQSAFPGMLRDRYIFFEEVHGLT
jgi:hypothetical protein